VYITPRALQPVLRRRPSATLTMAHSI